MIGILKVIHVLLILTSLCCLLSTILLFIFSYTKEAVYLLLIFLITGVTFLGLRYITKFFEEWAMPQGAQSYSILTGDGSVHGYDSLPNSQSSTEPRDYGSTEPRNYGSTESVPSTIKAFTPRFSSSAETPQLQAASSNDLLTDNASSSSDESLDSKFDICSRSITPIAPGKLVPRVPETCYFVSSCSSSSSSSSNSKSSEVLDTNEVKSSSKSFVTVTSLSSKSFQSVVDNISSKSNTSTESFEKLSCPSSSQ